MTDLTPLEIQKQRFGRTMRGYAEDEVRGYLHLVAEEVERLLSEAQVLSRENALLRDEIAEHSGRERILKDTLLSAQRVSEELKSNAEKEAELIIKDAELISERMISQALSRVGDLERAIQELKLERKAARIKLQAILDTFQQMLSMDVEQEEHEQPITQLHRRLSSEGRE
jgi:cell division initiation protein